MTFQLPYGPKNKIIESKSREIIYNVYIYFLNESKRFKHLEFRYFKKVQDRVALATGVSKSFVKRFIKRVEKEGVGALATPTVGRPKKQSTMVKETNTNNEPTSPERQPANKKSKLKIVSIKVDNETDSDDSDSDSSDNESLTNKAAERDSPPILVKSLPQIVNAAATVNSQTNTARAISTGFVTNSTTISRLPNLIKCNQNYQSIFANFIPQLFSTDSAVFSPSPPSVSSVPISLNSATATTNSPALPSEDMMHMNTNNIDNCSDEKNRGIAMSPMSVFVGTSGRNSTNILVTSDINVAGGDSVAETDLKIVKVESLAVDDPGTIR